MSHEGYHEPYELLPDNVRDMHRAIVSLMEELEAVDWYYQRAAVASDDALRAVLLHNAHEELEHAMMVLEWIRRHDPKVDEHMRTYLFTSGSITAAEADAKGATQSAGAAATAVETSGTIAPSLRRGSLPTVGSLRKEREDR